MVDPVVELSEFFSQHLDILKQPLNDVIWVNPPSDKRDAVHVMVEKAIGLGLLHEAPRILVSLLFDEKILQEDQVRGERGNHV